VFPVLLAEAQRADRIMRQQLAATAPAEACA
jgi:hypothetical protein